MGCSWSKKREWNFSGNSVSSECESIVDDDLYTNERKTNVESEEQTHQNSTESVSVRDRAAYFQQRNDLTRKLDTANVAQTNIKNENNSLSKEKSPKIWTGESSERKQHNSRGKETHKVHELKNKGSSKKESYSSTLKKKNSFHRNDSYQKRKVNGFKDLKLEQQVAECLEIKSRLKKVGDPDSVNAREKKLQKLKEERKKKSKGPLGLSDDELKIKLQNLKKISSKSKLQHNENKLI